jgi:hypothetical protein
MADSDIYRRVKSLCEKNNTNVTALIVEITGSTGNSTTWKKGHIRSDYLAAICTKFDVPSDYILGIGDTQNQIHDLSPRALSFALRFDALDEDGKTVVGSAIIQEERRVGTKKDLVVNYSAEQGA